VISSRATSVPSEPSRTLVLFVVRAIRATPPGEEEEHETNKRDRVSPACPQPLVCCDPLVVIRQEVADVTPDLEECYSWVVPIEVSPIV
jgi:hypothetical protein